MIISEIKNIHPIWAVRNFNPDPNPLLAAQPKAHLGPGMHTCVTIVGDHKTPDPARNQLSKGPPSCFKTCCLGLCKAWFGRTVTTYTKGIQPKLSTNLTFGVKWWCSNSGSFKCGIWKFVCRWISVLHKKWMLDKSILHTLTVPGGTYILALGGSEHRPLKNLVRWKFAKSNILGSKSSF